MKLNKITVACALAFGALSANSAWANCAAALPADQPNCLDVAWVDVAANTDIDLYLSGASAPQNFLGSIATQMFTGAIHSGTYVYYDKQSKGSNYRAYYGLTKSDTTIPGTIQGKNVLLVDRAKGGAVWGVEPVARGLKIAYMPVTSANCSGPDGTSATRWTNQSYDYLCSEVGDDLNPAAAGNKVPDFGVSDVEPAMFKGPANVAFGRTALSPAELNNLTGSVKSTAGMMFGVAVTNSLYSSIQNFQPAQVHAALTKSVSTWGQILGTADTTPITVCRREQGSGTQASFNAYFNKFPCDNGNLVGGGATTPKRMSQSAGYGTDPASGDGTLAAESSPGAGDGPIIIDPTAGYTVIENPASGAVRTCLNGAQTGHDVAFVGDDGLNYLVKFSNATAGSIKAIGLLSLDSKDTSHKNGYGDGTGAGSWTLPASNWTFAQLMGVSPTAANAQSLAYDFIMEQTMQYRTSNVNVNAPALANDLTSSGLKKAFVDDFVGRAQNPAILALISNADVKDSVAAIPPTYKPNNTNSAKVLTGTRFGNSCAPLQKLYSGLENL